MLVKVLLFACHSGNPEVVPQTRWCFYSHAKSLFPKTYASRHFYARHLHLALCMTSFSEISESITAALIGIWIGYLSTELLLQSENTATISHFQMAPCIVVDRQCSWQCPTQPTIFLLGKYFLFTGILRATGARISLLNCPGVSLDPFTFKYIGRQ